MIHDITPLFQATHEDGENSEPDEKSEAAVT